MRSKTMILLSILLGIAISSKPSEAGEVSPKQSNASPYGLSAIAPVMERASDKASNNFQANDLEGLQKIVNATLTENQKVDNVNLIALNPDDLILSETSDVRIYFIGEGAGYANSLGMFTGDSADKLSGDAALIFPNASAQSSYLSQGGEGNRTNRAPLLSGDFVDAGTFDSGTQLNLFLIANGANGGGTTFYSDTEQNSDGIAHFVVLAVPDSPYILVGVEDLTGGGDKDYNDVVFVMDIGRANTQQLISNAVPLPGYMAYLIGPGLLLMLRRRKGV
ncbi:DUF4114 domain-containing protein [Temperatibacter marinus]|uniref:DUF4114 domain-containing protein n=1 Tax=Temperatibacter marinus TaxID=1456591 RepID=A0AA52EI89_9PROT|nr:DUF4114 domain-containing protein [Temperatibacter marinus]WND03280.1 DUF4114 domain-containing protein [Temperatibacter marinus]